MRDRIQDGVYFRKGQQAPPCYRLLLLNATDGAGGDDVRSALHSVLSTLRELKNGKLRELSGAGRAEVAATAQSFRGFDALLGFGRRLFDGEAHQPPLTKQDRPDALTYLIRQGNAFPSLPWGRATGTANPGEADVALQLTGWSEAAVNRAAVETWKLLVDEGLPLRPAASFTGFQRPDGRGWLEFHDGLSNIESSQRLQALAALPDPGWMGGGTYMVYLRLAVDLEAWRRLPRRHQELLVGRDKLSGAPLVAVIRDGAGQAVPVPAPPPGHGSGARDRADYADPAQTTDPLLEASHVHRANQNRASPFAPAGLRIFRQGYDYLESIGPSGPSAGLNFVSFQSDLATVQHLLHLPGWLGDVNFGGPVDHEPGEPDSPSLVALQAGGLYAVPPRGVPFPGAGILESG